MTGSHHGNDKMTGSQQRKFVQRHSHCSRSFHTAHPSFPRRLKIATGKYLRRFSANQHAVVVTSADWKSSRAARSCTNKNSALPGTVHVGRKTYTALTYILLYSFPKPMYRLLGVNLNNFHIPSYTDFFFRYG